MPVKKITKTTKTKSAKATSASRTARPRRVSAKSVDSVETFDQLAASKVSSQPVNRRRTILIAIGVVIFGIVLFLAYRTLVVAWVDQTPITRWAYYQQLDQQYGQSLKDKMISDQLVANEASRRKVSVSDQEVNAELDKIKTQVGGEDKFNQLLQLQGLDLNSVKKELQNQLLLKKMFNDQIQVTDQEVTDYITNNKAQLPSPVTDDVKAQIKDQIANDKLNQVVTKWLADAKSSNRVIQY